MGSPDLNGRWQLPEGVTIAPGIDLGLPDPALLDGVRKCVALTRAGKRCTVNAFADSLLCTAHAGRLDSSAGGRAKAQKHLRLAEAAETRMVEARMGARAVIAARAIERANDLRRAFDVVLDDTIAGDKAQARNLLGYLQAAFPDVPQPDRPGTQAGDELTSLSTSQLRALAFPSD